MSELERQIRRGLLGLLKVFRRNRITVRGFLKMYTERFTTRNGYATVEDTSDTPTPTVTPAPEVPLADRIAQSDARNAMLKATRKETAKERLKSLSKVYQGK